MRFVRLIPLTVMIAAFALASGATAADAERGKLLYDTRCNVCHGQSVHSREAKSAASCDSIRGFVTRWAQYLGTNWSAEEIDDVTLHLNERYYRFPVRDGRCVTSLAARLLR